MIVLKRSVLAICAMLLPLLVPLGVVAAPVTFTGATLRAETSGDALTAGGGRTAHAEDLDTGDLTKRSVTAEAIASLPFSGTDFPVSRNNASASLNSFGDGLRVDGTADSIVFVKSSPFLGTGLARSLASVLFRVDLGGAHQLSYDASVVSTTPGQGTRLNLQLLDQAQQLIRQIALSSTIAQETQAASQSVNLAPGEYTLSVDAQAASDVTGFGAADSGNVRYQVTLAPDGSGTGGGGGVVIPLPSAMLSGLAVLPVALGLTRWSKLSRILRGRT